MNNNYCKFNNLLLNQITNFFVIIIGKNENILLKGKKHLEIFAEKKILFFKPGGSRANQAKSFDIENTSLHKPSNIMQLAFKKNNDS